MRRVERLNEFVDTFNEQTVRDFFQIDADVV
jgi:hypothetical protein